MKALSRRHMLGALVGVASLLGFAGATTPAAAAPDLLEKIEKAGVIRVATFDSNPPFGSIDPKTHKIVGYDVDFAEAIAKSLGVRLQLVATNPANRIPLIQSGKVDLIVADITITPERAKVIDFSTPYFVTGQELLVPAGASDNLQDYATSRIGAVKGTTGEQELKNLFPKGRVLSYDDIPLALSALRSGSVDAISQDSTILNGLLANAPDKAKYKILKDRVSTEIIGIGVAKGQNALLSRVNQVLVDLEKSGEAARIYEKWFGADSPYHAPRAFTIVASNEK